jgi:hypothetical protein
LSVPYSGKPGWTPRSSTMRAIGFRSTAGRAIVAVSIVSVRS